MAIYWVDPDASDDTGDGSKSNPWKTTNHTVSPGDEVRIKKSPLTTMAWTVSGTYGQRDLIASADPSSDVAADDVIKVDGDFYIIRGLSGTTIQTYKPFLGFTGGGKTCKKVGVFDIGSTYWQIYSSGNATSRVYYKGGYDWSSETQDGHTFIKSSANYCLYGNNKYWFEVQRLSLVKANVYTAWLYCGEFNYKNSVFGYGNTYSLYSYPPTTYKNGVFENCETHNKGSFIYGDHFKLNSVDFWLYGSQLVYFGQSGKLMFLDACRIDGSTHSSYAVQARGDLICTNTDLGSVISNAKNSFDPYGDRVLVYCVNSKFSIEDTYPQYNNCKVVSIRHNGNTGDNRTVLVRWEGSYGLNGVVQTDSVVYRTESPSLKFTPKQSNYKVFQIFQVPLKSGASTISIYLRKTGSYNGSYYPRVKMRYYTGTDPVVFVEDVLEMANVNDVWVQMSKTVSLDDPQVMELEVYGCGTTGNFWCDDLEVT